MASPPSELSLDYKPSSFPALQKPFGDQPEQTQRLEEFVARLEEERLKIEAFKRELPLCMQLLTNAMETYKQQLEAYQTSQGAKPVLEEFIPLKSMSSDGTEKPSNAFSEKASWMVSAQLWSSTSDAVKESPLAAAMKEPERPLDVSPKLALDGKQRNGGAFLPFSKEKTKGPSNGSQVLPDLALASPNKETEGKSFSETENGGTGARRDSNGSKGSASVTGEQGKGSAEGQAGTQTHRKPRRCWSPDLHRRFVNALQILGGSQVATPKQIRELMKVDGLTNDEVKSHLQKYRLHTRRPMPAPQPSSAAAPQLVVLGGIWVPPEYATSAAAAAAAAPAIYGAHPGAAHYCGPPVAQEFYPAAAAAAAAAHHHHLQPPLPRSLAASYKGRVVSPESDMRTSGAGERSESIEEEEEGEGREEEEEEEEEMDTDEKSAAEKALVPVSQAVAEGGGLKF